MNHPTTVKKCKHQFFETNKKVEYYPRGSDLNMLQISTVEKYGVRVVCALCGEKRIIWQDGKINVWNKKKDIWVNL